MALAARIDGRSYRTYCMVGDGELGEGQIWEAAMAAGHFRLGSLVCIVDRNQLSIDGPTEEVMGVEPLTEKFHCVRLADQPHRRPRRSTRSSRPLPGCMTIRTVRRR